MFGIAERHSCSSVGNTIGFLGVGDSTEGGKVGLMVGFEGGMVGGGRVGGGG